MNFLTKIKSYLHQNDNVTLPWEFQENSENTRNARTEILEIYKQEQIFFDQHDDFPFVFENIIDIANEVVQKDPNLGLLHKKFVSKKQEQIIKGYLFSSEWMIINSGKVTLDRLKLQKQNSSFLVFSNLKMRIFKYEKIQKIFICCGFHHHHVYLIDGSKVINIIIVILFINYPFSLLKFNGILQFLNLQLKTRAQIKLYNEKKPQQKLNLYVFQLKRLHKLKQKKLISLFQICSMNFLMNTSYQTTDIFFIKGQNDRSEKFHN
ncbi:hypothetical protein pb186bvf_009678 [Paramecium bursaria]